MSDMAVRRPSEAAIERSGADGAGPPPHVARGLNDTDALLHGIVALAADAIVSTDERFRITLFNGAAERIFGYRAEEVIGQQLDCLLPETARPAHRGHLERFARGDAESREMGERGQIWGRRRTGELFPAEASISRITVSDTVHFTAVVRDVTRQRREEQDREAMLVRETEAHAAADAANRRVSFLARASEVMHSSLAYDETLAALVHLVVPDLASYCVVDVVEEDGTVRRLHVAHANPDQRAIAERLRLYPRNQAAYLSRRVIQSGEPELVTEVTDALLVARAEDDDHLAVLRALHPASFVIAPLRSRQRVLGALMLVRDTATNPYTGADLELAVDLAQRAASALDNARLYNRATRAIHARDEVLGVVSHDLRNPLSVISMCTASLLAGSSAADEQTREALQTVQQSARWAQRLIQDLLDVASIEAGGLSITHRREDPVLLVTRAAVLFEELAAERSIALVTELPEWLPDVDVDGDRIVQALGNLVANAIAYTPVGGEIRLGARVEGEHVQLYVADSGPGIPAEDVPHVFDRFWTARRSARARGTGMGLAIVRGIAAAHGADVWVERSAAGGALFVLALPTARGQTATPAESR